MLDVILNVGGMALLVLLVCGLSLLFRQTDAKERLKHEREPEGIGTFENVLGFRSSVPKGPTYYHPTDKV
ncbi:MAG: hypothetical protein ACFCD0_01190 [Gemmataceae bacterium]